MLALDLRDDHVEGRPLDVELCWFKQADRGELAESPEQAYRLGPLSLVKKNDHGSAGAKVLKTERKLRDSESSSFSRLPICSSLMFSQDLAIAHDKIEAIGGIELVREKVVDVRVRGRAIADAHVQSEQVNVQELVRHVEALWDEHFVASIAGRETYPESASAGIDFHGCDKESSRRHAHVENGGVVILGTISDGEGTTSPLVHLPCDCLHHVVEDTRHFLARIISLLALFLEVGVACRIAPPLCKSAGLFHHPSRLDVEACSPDFEAQSIGDTPPSSPTSRL